MVDHRAGGSTGTSGLKGFADRVPRSGSVRLAQICSVLGLPEEHFHRSSPRPLRPEDEMRRLIEAFSRIDDGGKRKSLIDLAEMMALGQPNRPAHDLTAQSTGGAVEI